MYRFPTHLTERHAEVRDHVRSWVEAHPDPTPVDYARAGLVAPGWPAPWGLDAGVGGQLVVRSELEAAGLAAPVYLIEVNWVGPTFLHAGSPEQRERYLWPLLEGRERWCRLHSEPDAGSDLSMVATRAEQTATGYRLTGQKIWTFQAQMARFGALLARTSGARGDAEGISYFILPMDAPGVTIRPIMDLGGRSTVSEVFLDDVEIPADHLLGGLGEGLYIRRLNDPPPPATFNPVIGHPGGHPSHELLGLAAFDDVPGRIVDELIDRYLTSQSIDALAVVDSEQQWNTGDVSLQRTDIRRWLVQEQMRDSYELVHELRAEAEALGNQPVLDRLDHYGLAHTHLPAALASVPNGGSDIHLETITARLFDQSSPVRTAWAGDR